MKIFNDMLELIKNSQQLYLYMYIGLLLIRF